MLGKLGQPQLIPVWLRLSGRGYFFYYIYTYTVKGGLWGVMFLETETEKDKHCNVWMRKSKSKGPGRRAGPRRGQGRGVRMRGGGIPRAARTVVSDEICATIIDHVINHGLSLREAGERVQPNLRRSTVASIIASFNKPTGKYCILHGLFLFSLDMSIWSYSNAYVEFFVPLKNATSSTLWGKRKAPQ